jgi:hypothetical protein
MTFLDKKKTLKIENCKFKKRGLLAKQITTENLPELLDLYEKISELILYISNATINQYVLLLDRFAFI